MRRFPDPEMSTDPKIQSLLGQLRVLEIAPPPRACFKAELRAQLVAVAPRLVVEGTPDLVMHTPESLAKVEATREPSALQNAADRVRGLHFGRPLAIGATGLTIAVLAVGGTVWLSRSALPGDTLYGVKRTAESVQYSLTSGTQARAKEQLHYAATRADEVQQLLGKPTALALGEGPNAAAGTSPRTATLITKTLGAADSNVQDAARLLGGAAVQQQSVQPLAVMAHWLPTQQHRLEEIVDRIPAGTLHDRAVQSKDLLEQVIEREIAIAKATGCPACMQNAVHDELGPNPRTVGAIGTGGPQPGATTQTDAPAARSGSASGASSGAAASVPPPPGGGATPTPGAASAAPPNLIPTPGPVASLTSGLGSVVSGATGALGSVVNGATSAVGGLVNGATSAVNNVVNTSPSPTQSCVVNANILGLPINVLC